MVEKTFPTLMTTYYRYEIALRYFPGISPQAAQRRLNNWIRGCPDLQKALEKTHFNKMGKSFTRKQVLLLEEYLGVP